MKKATTVLCAFAAAFAASGATTYFSADGTGDGSSAESPKAFSASAVAAAVAASDGTAVLLDGNYTLDATIMVDGGTLEGQSRDGVVFGVAEDIEPATGFFVVKGGGTLKNFTVKDMTTTASADIVYVDGASSVSDATFSNVSSAYPIVFFSAATGVASNLLVSACTVAKSHNEGGIFSSSANAPNVYDSVIENSVNTAARGNVGRNIRFFRCKVDGFTGGSDGMLFGDAMFDCFVKDYKGSRLARAANFYNCTIVGSRLSAGMIGWSGNVYNTLFYDNKNAAGTAYATLGGDASYYYCWAETDAGTTTKQFNCISGDDPGFKAEGDARLAASSPCIDAGNNTYIASGNTYYGASRTVDFYGNARNAGDAVDIGCFEKAGYDDGEFAANFNSAASGTAHTSDEVSLVLSFRADAGRTCTIKVDFGDGTSLETLRASAEGGNTMQTLTVSHVYSVGGAFAVTATFTLDDADSSSLTVSKLNVFQVVNALEGDVYVSPSGNDANAGTDRNAPKSSVVSALYAVNNGNVIIAPGTYEMTGDAFEVSSATKIIGDDRDTVVLTGGKSDYIFRLNNASASVENLTIRGITNLSTTAACIYIAAGTVDNIFFDRCNGAAPIVHIPGSSALSISNCDFDACKGTWMVKGGNAANIKVFDSTFRNCTSTERGVVQMVSLFRAVVDGCAAMEETLFHVNVYDSLIVNNKNAQLARPSCNVYNSTIAGNAGVNLRWGSNPSFYNCIFADNNGTIQNGNIYNCHVDKMNESAADITKDEATVVNENVLSTLMASYAPRRNSPVVGGGRYFTPGATTVDATYFPQVSLRAVDLAGEPRVRTSAKYVRDGTCLDVGCYQGILADGFRLVVR